MMTVQRGHDEVQVITDDCGSLCVASFDITNKIGNVAQLTAEESVDNRHAECVGRHSSVCTAVAASGCFRRKYPQNVSR
jgi:hypothetical protein